MKPKKHFLLFALFAIVLMCCDEKPAAPAIIFDTDIAPDYDDVGALAMLHAFADEGEANILATVSSNAFATTAPTLSVINTYYNRPDVPIGVVKASQPSYSCPQLWAEHIISKYPHAIKSNEDALDAVTLYRKILAAQPDASVTIVTVGFLTNLSNLLKSVPDEYSPLDGQELIQKKVKRLVSMAAGIDSTGNSGYEANILADIPASQHVFFMWPTPITLSGFEIGANIFTGMKLISNSSIQDSPVKDAYQVSLALDGSTVGHYSWDQTAVLVAVKGTGPWFDSRLLDLTNRRDGKDSVIDGDRITYLVAKQTPEEIATVLEELMMREPSRSPIE